MEDPLAHLIVYSAAKGYVDFSTCDYSRRWWTAANLMMQIASNDLDAKSHLSEVIRNSALQSSEDAEFSIVSEEAKKFSNKYRSALKPYMARMLAVRDTNDELDLQALLYLNWAPEMLGLS